MKNKRGVLKTKRELAGELIGRYGRYMGDAPYLSYYVRLGNRSFHSYDTAELADQVAAAFTRTQLVDMVVS